MNSSFRLGCQTITFGERQAQRFGTMLAVVAAASYAGVEIGFRHIRTMPPQALADLLRQNHLELLASHVGGDLNDLQAASGERRLFDEVIEYLNATGTNLLMYSGLRNHDPAQFAHDLELLHGAAKAYQDRGIRLLYHNHDWEFADGGYIIDKILALECPAIGLCVDIGWVMKGGQDAVDFLDRANDHVQAVHFKDFGQGPVNPPVVDTVMLGEGVAPLAQTAAWLKYNRRDLWVIAEQDVADIPPEVAVTANARYLQKLFPLEGRASC